MVASLHCSACFKAVFGSKSEYEQFKGLAGASGRSHPSCVSVASIGNNRANAISENEPNYEPVAPETNPRDRPLGYMMPDFTIALAAGLP